MLSWVARKRRRRRQLEAADVRLRAASLSRIVRSCLAVVAGQGRHEIAIALAIELGRAAAPTTGRRAVAAPPSPLLLLQALEKCRHSSLTEPGLRSYCACISSM